ncbi:MAG: winged helix-turn-helix transcriptional regulator [Chitinispirillales bacterium]|nr:winged helix-turn-helix transcriptional regulator [Chitinispirillales bacterium]
MLLKAIKFNPQITRNELAAQLNRTPDSIKHSLARLIREGVITREGSDRAGKWVILV